MTKLIYLLIFILAIYFALRILLVSLYWLFGSAAVVIALGYGAYLYYKK
jgi:hypothetical protein